MGLRINTNLASIAAQRQLSLSSRSLENTMKSLSSGSRFSNSLQSSAEFGIAESLRGQISGVRAGTRNAENANSFVAVAEGGLHEQNNILIRMRELAIQAASDTYGDDEREMLNEEFQSLGEELDRIAQTTQFGTQKLLNGDERDYEFQVGAYAGDENVIKYKSDANTTASALNVDGLSVNDRSDARSSLESLDGALLAITKARASFGATQSRLESATNNGMVQAENLEGARSRLADTDVAQAVSEMTKQQALQQYQLSVLREANQYPGSIMKLIG